MLWDSLYESFSKIKFETQRQVTKDGDKAAYEILKELRKSAKEKIYKLRDEFFIEDSICSKCAKKCLFIEYNNN